MIQFQNFPEISSLEREEEGGLNMLYTVKKRLHRTLRAKFKLSSKFWPVYCWRTLTLMCTHVHALWTRPKVHPDRGFWGCCQRKGGGYWMISSHPAFCLSSVQSHSTEKKWGFVIVSSDCRSMKTLIALPSILERHHLAYLIRVNIYWLPLSNKIYIVYHFIIWLTIILRVICLILHCLFSLSIHGGDAKSADIEKAIRQTLKFLNPTNRLHENTSNFYKSAKYNCWC